MAFSPENLKIWVNSREIHAFIPMATYPLFMKGTDRLAPAADYFRRGRDQHPPLRAVGVARGANPGTVRGNHGGIGRHDDDDDDH